MDALKGIRRPRTEELTSSQLAEMEEDLQQQLSRTEERVREELCLMLFDVNRTEELTSSQLAEMEEDLQQQLSRTEERVREEEQKKLDESIAMLQIKHDNELADLQTTIERLTKQYQEESKLNSPREDAIKLRAQIRDLMQENEELRSSLMKAQINVSVLQVELDRLQNAFTDQKLQHERESDDLKKMVMEFQSYSSQIEFLQEMNKTLYDSNDGLRSALSQDIGSSKKRLSPKNEVPPRKMKPLRQSTMNQSGFTKDEDTMALVKCWADKYLDSGVSVQTDAEPMSGSDYDSDGSQNSVETVQHSYSCVPSELEVSELKCEAVGSVARSTVGSISSSLRRRLSAFPVKQTEEDLFRSIARSYFRKAHGVLLLYDVTSESSFLNVREWVEQIRESTDEDIPMCVIGNKVDLRAERPEGSCVSAFHGEKLAMSYNALFCEASAKEGTNVIEAVLHLARKVKKHAKLGRRESQVKLSLHKRKTTLSNCCGV
ncbi:ras and EF-hand domain-containing protein-like [Sinocyclocheilus rhinocerous]|uniref:ras and EF-hand domain-containing protein-like n=1 Tax=Sinocyclocheilus rhinocerous TaxID=307959 RepID=UPI0007BA757D|nr:PREDICTED: ras and EF-hand domain-containing protein-like [Sinocyclocheilus rhinocerous]